MGVAVGGPLVKTLGRPISVGVAGTVLVVAVSTSGVVSESRGVAGLSLPLMVAITVTVILVPLHILVAIIGIDTIGVAVLAGLSLPLVKTLGAPVGVRVAGTVLVVAVASSGVVSEGRSVAVGGPLAKTAKFRVIDIGIVAVDTDIIGGGDTVVAVLAVDRLVALTRGGSTGRETEDNKRFCCHDFLCVSSSAELQCVSESPCTLRDT